MRYIKVLLLVLLFFVSMLFFFQNQETLGRDMALKLDLFFLSPVKPLTFTLPTYFVLLAGFLLGALFAMVMLVWDKITLSARLMQAQWKIRNFEKELAQYANKSAPVAAPAATKAKLPIMAGKAPRDITAPDPDRNG